MQGLVVPLLYRVFEEIVYDRIVPVLVYICNRIKPGITIGTTIGTTIVTTIVTMGNYILAVAVCVTAVWLGIRSFKQRKDPKNSTSTNGAKTYAQIVRSGTGNNNTPANRGRQANPTSVSSSVTRHGEGRTQSTNSSSTNSTSEVNSRKSTVSNAPRQLEVQTIVKVTYAVNEVCEECGYEFKCETHIADHICKFYGYFQCIECSNRWQSAHTWEGKHQVCKKCDTPNYVYEVERLIRDGEPKDDNHKPHETSLCERCLELGRPCYTRRSSAYYDYSED